MKTSKAMIQKIQLDILKDVRDSVYLDLNENEHFQDQDLANEDYHGNQLIKMISSIYLRTLLHHHGRLFTERYVNKNKASKRHHLTKTILFLGQ